MGLFGGLDLAEVSDNFKKRVLIPSGGWLGDIVVLISRISGIWDLLLASVIFVLSWITIRISDRVPALILARVFDTTVPLQHYLSENKDVQALHQAHLDQYWRLYWIGTIIEIAAYFFFHPDLFTLVTCFKTTILIFLWMGRNNDGSFWTSGIKYASTVPLSPKPTTQAPTPLARPASPPTHPPQKLVVKDTDGPKEWNELLKSKGYSDSDCRREMIGQMKRKPEDVKRLRGIWLGDTDKKVTERNIRKAEERRKRKAKGS